MKKYYLFVLILFGVLFLGSLATHAAGIIEGNIWYSKENFEEGDTVKIYTIIFNTNDDILAGIVEFYDDETILGSKNFSVATGSFVDVFVQWKVIAGDHIIFAQIIDPKIVKADGDTESVALNNTTTGKDEFFISKKIIQNDKEDNPTDIIEDFIPENIIETVSDATEGINTWREGIVENIEKKKEENKKKIEELKLASEENTNEEDIKDINVEKSLKQGYGIILNGAYYAFSQKFLFYGITLFILFFVVRFMWKRIRRKKNSYDF